MASSLRGSGLRRLSVLGPSVSAMGTAHRLDPATPEDLTWWLSTAPTLTWTWARTYAATAPHWYVVLGRTAGLTRDDFARAGRVVRTFGEPGKFYSMTNLYLFTEDRSRKFWCMWGEAPNDGDADLINMATTERTYGEQDNFDLARLDVLRLG